MSRGDEARVADILDAAVELAEVVEIGREAFPLNPIHVRAAERLLEIIGEASNDLSDDFKLAHAGEVRDRDGCNRAHGRIRLNRPNGPGQRVSNFVGYTNVYRYSGGA